MFNKCDNKKVNYKYENKSKRNRFKTIIITGTPGTGKTMIAKLLSKIVGFNVINVNDLIKKNKISEGYDKKRKCIIVDVKKLKKAIIKIINNCKKNCCCSGLIIESHLSHNLPKNYVDYCIVTKCDLKELKKRLIKRGYNAEKVRENLDSEIFDICLVEATEKGHKCIVMDTTKPEKLSAKLKKITNFIKKFK